MFKSEIGRFRPVVTEPDFEIFSAHLDFADEMFQYFGFQDLEDWINEQLWFRLIVVYPAHVLDNFLVQSSCYFFEVIFLDWIRRFSWFGF